MKRMQFRKKKTRMIFFEKQKISVINPHISTFQKKFRTLKNNSTIHNSQLFSDVASTFYVKNVDLQSTSNDFFFHFSADN